MRSLVPRMNSPLRCALTPKCGARLSKDALLEWFSGDRDKGTMTPTLAKANSSSSSRKLVLVRMRRLLRLQSCACLQNHGAMYVPFVYHDAPAMIAPAHPFGVYPPGTTLESLGSSGHARDVMDGDEDEQGGDEGNLNTLCPLKRATRRCRVARGGQVGPMRPMRADAGYEAGGRVPACADAGEAERVRVGGNDNALPMPVRKRRKNAQGEYTPVDVDLEVT